MPDELRTVAVDAELHVRGEESREIDLRIMPWGVVGRTNEGPERFRRGAFRGVDPSTVTLEAIGAHAAEPGVRLAGRGISLEERDDGAYMTLRASRTRAGDELLELARDGVYRGASVVFAEVPGGSVRGRDGVTERTRVDLRRVGIVERGAYPTAEVLAVRSQEGSDMPALETPAPEPEPTPTPAPTPTPTPDPPAVFMGRSAADPDALEALRTDLVGRMVALEGRSAGGGGSHPLARFASFGAYADAAYLDPELAPLLGRALVDQVTGDNPGVMQPTWLTTVAGLIERPRPAVTALGGPRSLGESGMEIDWPYLDPALDLDAIVGKQLAEKSEITSVKVKILKGTSPIATYAGGSDVSYQLIRRSQPSYREAYLRVLAIAYARTTEAAFEAALALAAVPGPVLAPDSDADAFRAWLFGASAQVEDATGAPASVVLASPDEWLRIGGLPGLFPPVYGLQNVAGTAQASTLRINVSGLEIIRAPFLPAGILATNEEAAGWHEDGPIPASAEDIAKLGQNIATWGMGATVVTAPAGIVKSVAAAGRSSARS
jgi:phage head maturation protease